MGRGDDRPTQHRAVAHGTYDSVVGPTGECGERADGISIGSWSTSVPPFLDDLQFVEVWSACPSVTLTSRDDQRIAVPRDDARTLMELRGRNGRFRID